jgi:hypothetical protein
MTDGDIESHKDMMIKWGGLKDNSNKNSSSSIKSNKKRALKGDIYNSPLKSLPSCRSRSHIKEEETNLFDKYKKLLKMINDKITQTFNPDEDDTDGVSTLTSTNKISIEYNTKSKPTSLDLGLSYLYSELTRYLNGDYYKNEITDTDIQVIFEKVFGSFAVSVLISLLQFVFNDLNFNGVKYMSQVITLVKEYTMTLSL